MQCKSFVRNNNGTIEPAPYYELKNKKYVPISYTNNDFCLIALLF